jgi:Mg-chelatase subunit ChlD
MGEGDPGRLARRRKKKGLTSSSEDDENLPRPSTFRSIFSQASKDPKLAPPEFLPPEAFGSATVGLDEDDAAVELSSASAWDIATRYHEFKAKPSFKKAARELRRISAEAVIERAREVLGSVVHPSDTRIAPWPELPLGAEQVDFDLEESIEASPLAFSGRSPLLPEDVWMSYAAARRHSVVLSVDTSLSMTGEKLALTAVALAVVLLQFPEDPVGIVAFENEAQVIKRPEERISIQQLVERFLDVPAQGYTHLEEGMKGALALVRRSEATGGGKSPSTVLLTDGKYTAGRDPAYLAPRFPHLVVLKMGKERASLELCRELAHKGCGALREVGELEALPTVMYGVVKDLLRGF